MTNVLGTGPAPVRLPEHLPALRDFKRRDNWQTLDGGIFTTGSIGPAKDVVAGFGVSPIFGLFHWDPETDSTELYTHKCLDRKDGKDTPTHLVYAWSPDGRYLAGGFYYNQSGIFILDLEQDGYAPVRLELFNPDLL